MAITFPITGVSNQHTTATRSPAFTLGTSPIENDILVAFVTSGSNAIIGTVSGWTNVLGTGGEIEPSDGVMNGSMVYHRVTADEDTADTVAWTLTNLFDSNKNWTITVAVLRGVVTTGELVGTATASDATNNASPWIIADVTPTADDCQIMAGVGGDSTQTQTTPGTHSLQASNVAGNTSNYLYSDDTLGSNGVATGTTEVTPSAGDEYVSIVACFKAATGATSHPVTASGSTTTTGSAALVVNGYLTASGSTTTDGSAAIHASRSVTADGSTTTDGSAAISGLLSLVAGGSASTGGIALLTLPSLLVPQNLVATAIDSSSILLEWTPFPDAITYDIERDAVVIVTDVVTSSYTDTGLDQTTEYLYRVRAKV